MKSIQSQKVIFTCTNVIFLYIRNKILIRNQFKLPILEIT